MPELTMLVFHKMCIVNVLFKDVFKGLPKQNYKKLYSLKTYKLLLISLSVGLYFLSLLNIGIDITHTE